MKWNPDETPNFSFDEMKCKCGCGKADMDRDFMMDLQALREAVGPLKVSSAYRCPEHNQNVSSTGPDGPHTTGKAADILCSGSHAHEVLMSACFFDFGGIGVQQRGAHSSRFIHLDTLTEGPRPNVWSY